MIKKAGIEVDRPERCYGDPGRLTGRHPSAGRFDLTAGLGGGQDQHEPTSTKGVFTILQKKARGAFTTLRLDGGSFPNCGPRAGKAP